jgi:hypothetical protein
MNTYIAYSCLFAVLVFSGKAWAAICDDNERLCVAALNDYIDCKDNCASSTSTLVEQICLCECKSLILKSRTDCRPFITICTEDPAASFNVLDSIVADVDQTCAAAYRSSCSYAGSTCYAYAKAADECEKECQYTYEKGKLPKQGT